MKRRQIIVNHNFASDKEHLSETEIEQLLGEQAEARALERANQHLDQCEECQSLLQSRAAKPEDWKSFVSVMETQNEYQETEYVSNENIAPLCPEESIAHKENASSRKYKLITGFVLVTLTLLSLPKLIDYLNEGRPTGDPPEPPAAVSPGAPPPAPGQVNANQQTNSSLVKLPDLPDSSAANELQSARQQVEDINQKLK